MVHGGKQSKRWTEDPAGGDDEQRWRCAEQPQAVGAGASAGTTHQECGTMLRNAGFILLAKGCDRCLTSSTCNASWVKLGLRGGEKGAVSGARAYVN